jgi:hypothetical protein
MSYVVMFGYGRGPTHYNVPTWVGLIVFQKTNINKMQIQYLLFGYGGLCSH